MSKLIRISQKTYDKLNALAKETGSSKQDLVEQALEKLSREVFLQEVAKDFEELKNDPKAWQEYLEERAEWQSIKNKLEDL